jgi:hypothetical protein
MLLGGLIFFKAVAISGGSVRQKILQLFNPVLEQSRKNAVRKKTRKPEGAVSSFEWLGGQVGLDASWFSCSKKRHRS